MNETSTVQGLRARLPLAPKHEDNFRWRGTEVSRVEGFTDAVFAFAVTLLVVSLEVPHTFDGLLDVVRALPAFIICFTLLMTFWTAHFRYHRRYGLQDGLTRVTTMAILVLVLFFVYPLKFLFTMLTVGLFQLQLHDAPKIESPAQGDMLYLIYGLGFAGVWSLYGVLYWNALRRREELGLDAKEILLTRLDLAGNFIYVGVCLLSILLAYTLTDTAIPGLIYFALGPLHALNGWWFGRQVRALGRVTAG
ncbi:MAG TPA: TMEM175 family protein [Steroidobacteraceae bacterium]|jgi:uncharacterized membrane protein|nr:TMEM175 family protein [Steroidobacteraceae bacterium]